MIKINQMAILQSKMTRQINNIGQSRCNEFLNTNNTVKFQQQKTTVIKLKLNCNRFQVKI